VLVATWLGKLHVRDTRQHCLGPGRSRDGDAGGAAKADRHLERPGPCIFASGRAPAMPASNGTGEQPFLRSRTRFRPDASARVPVHDAPARDDEQERRVRLLLLSKGAVLAHACEHPLAAQMDDKQSSMPRAAHYRIEAVPTATADRAPLSRWTEAVGKCRHGGSPWVDVAVESARGATAPPRLRPGRPRCGGGGACGGCGLRR
jgi:hypothetical protein